LQKAGFIETIEDYLDVIANAWKGQKQHVHLVSAVFDYSAWVSGSVWEIKRQAVNDGANVVIGINENRYYVIAKRDGDGAVCMWYKPDPLHTILYPTLKDKAMRPVREGSKYQTDPAGIEIFRSLEGPKGSPMLAPFPHRQT